MNYYKRHIGDWTTATAHLTEIEECMYSRCLDQYYLREEPLPKEIDKVARLVRATSRAAKRALEIILNEFFKCQEDGWHQKRCDKELNSYKEKSEKNSASAQIRWGKTQCERMPNAMRTHSEGNASHKPLATNQELNTPIPPRGLDGFDQFWEQYPKRVAKGRAEKAWKAIKPNEQLLSQILAAIECAKTSEQWAKDEGRFIPHPATWLNAKGWLDEYRKGGSNAVVTKYDDPRLYE